MSTTLLPSDGIENVSRRDLLKAGAAVTLTLAIALRDPAAAAEAAGAGPTAAPAAKAGVPFAPSDFVRIGADNTVTVISKHLEMGQGIYTGLATLIAEELDASWEQLRVEGAPADASRYANLFLRTQGTGGSTSLSTFIRSVPEGWRGAARAMLVGAAAQRWGVPASEITVEGGRVSHTVSGKSAQFGELVGDAAKLPVPKDIKLKDPQQFRFIGKPMHRIDGRAKAQGTAVYTQDVQLPGMVTAVALHPERLGAKVKSFDATRAKAVKGVQAVVAYETPAMSGVAVIAKDFWSARKGREALSVVWMSPPRTRSTARSCSHNTARSLPHLANVRAGMVILKAPSPAPLARSKRLTSFPIWRMRRWSR